MDNLTHSLAGALIGQAGLKRKTGLAMPALVIGANLPDIDATCVIFGTASLAMRRGLTHGPIAWVLLPLVLAGLLHFFDHWQARRGTRPPDRLPVRFGWLYLLALIACLTHPALDWLNSYGIRFLSPFSERWFYGDVLFIIDLWLWLLLGGTLWLSLRKKKRGGRWRVPAWIGLAAALLYIGGNVLITRTNELLVQSNVPADIRTVIASPVPIAFWDRKVILGSPGDRWLIDGQGHGDIRLDRCNLPAAAARNRDVAAFLFWARAPFIERVNGDWRLRDARFAGPVAGDRFSVPLPPGICAEPG